MSISLEQYLNFRNNKMNKKIFFLSPTYETVYTVNKVIGGI